MKKQIPVLLDTDIGTDIDDSWALDMLLNCPELDLKLVTCSTGDVVYRAKLAARFLESARRTDVVVGVGQPTEMKPTHRTQLPWVENYDLGQYPGVVAQDGVGAMIATIMQSPEPVTIIAIGPLTTVAAALEREPRIAKNARFVGMHGSLRWSPDDKKDYAAIPEYNVVHDVRASQKVFTAPWPMTITPLDTCGRVRLTGAKYKAVAESRHPLARAVIENYKIWQQCGGWVKDADASSILFDCVAVYLAYADDLLAMRRMKVKVTDDGFTREDPAGREMNVAMEWKNMAAFEDLIVARLTEGK